MRCDLRHPAAAPLRVARRFLRRDHRGTSLRSRDSASSCRTHSRNFQRERARRDSRWGGFRKAAQTALRRMDGLFHQIVMQAERAGLKRARKSIASEATARDAGARATRAGKTCVLPVFGCKRGAESTQRVGVVEIEVVLIDPVRFSGVARRRCANGLAMCELTKRYGRSISFMLRKNNDYAGDPMASFRPWIPAGLVFLAGCAQRHLPAGSEHAMADVLIHHELAAPRSFLAEHRSRCPCYVFVGDMDLSPAHLAALSDTGVTFLPGSARVAGNGLGIRIGLPRHRWNGNFDVTQSYDCGPTCAGSGIAILRYDGSRWRVLRSD